MYEQCYISFKIILNKKFLVFEDTRLILSWINLLEMGKFAKTQIFGWMLGWKVKLKVAGAQPEIFRGRTGFLEQKHFDKHFMHEIQEKGSAGKILLFFFKIFWKLHFKWEFMHTNRALFANTGVPLVYFLKRQGKSPTLPLSS